MKGSRKKQSAKDIFKRQIPSFPLFDEGENEET